MRRTGWVFVIMLILAVTVQAQEATETPDAPDFAFEFPIEPATDAQIDEVYACPLSMDEDTEATPEAEDTSPACELAQQALALAKARPENTSPSDEEIELFHDILRQNPALIHRLDLLVYYFGASDLVAPPDFTHQPIVEMEFSYTFSGLGNSVDYKFTIENVHAEPGISGTARNDGNMGETPSDDELTIPETVDPALIQAFAPALQDFVPINAPISTIFCTDYYPDWNIRLTFADDTVVEVVNNGANVIGIGGPWQIEIDDQLYMQYSASFQEPVIQLLEALELPLGETAGMFCGELDDPIHAAFPREGTQP